jgi:hypothetical protein
MSILSPSQLRCENWLDGSEAKPQADAGPTVIGPIVIGVAIPVAIVGSVIRSVIAIPSMIVGTIAVAIPTVPIPNFLHLASSLTLRQRQNARLSGSGFRRGDHQDGHTCESQEAQNERTHLKDLSYWWRLNARAKRQFLLRETREQR